MMESYRIVKMIIITAAFALTYSRFTISFLHL